jgi:formylglycine-generating enzyme required for sulfatase activity
MAIEIVEPRIARVLAEGPGATTLVDLPGGTFTMGSDLRADELPVRTVRVAPFAAALTPVTNAEYRRFIDATGYEVPPFLDDPRFNEALQPVVGVSWFDAVAYCEWLSEVIGRRCRLPTEAEREYAARGGIEGGRYPWGDEPWSDGVHAYDSAGGDRPHAVGTTPANGFGLYHMGDNVHEWCSDWYGAYSPVAEAGPSAILDDPRGPTEGVRRASRGGSWRHRVKVTRTAARSSLAPERRYNDYGMRVYADDGATTTR